MITSSSTTDHLAWIEIESVNNPLPSLWASHRNNQNTWEPAQLIAARTPAFSLKASAVFAVLIWQNVQQSDQVISVSAFNDQRWQTPIELAAGVVSNPKLVVSDSNVTVGWQNDLNIELTGFPNASPKLFSSPGTKLQLATNRQADSLAVWLDDLHRIAFSQNIGGSWDNPEIIEQDTMIPASQLGIDMNDDGDAILIWIEDTTLFSAIFSESKWSAPTELGLTITTSPIVKIDAKGNGFVVLETRDGIAVKRYRKGKGWSDSVNIETGRDPQIFVRKNEAWLIWIEGGDQIMLKRFG